MKKYLGALIIGLFSFYYAAVYWLGDSNLWQARLLTSFDLNKPWVYRQLTPMLARLLAMVGIRVDLALVLVVTLAGVGFYFALRELIYTFYQNVYGDRFEIWIVVLVLLGLCLFGYDRLPYDLMTAWLWTLALLFLARGQRFEYMMLFPLLCLNRYDTAWLMVVYYWAYYLVFGFAIRKDRINFAWQIGIWVLITIGLHWYFLGNDGIGGWLAPGLNVRRFLAHPWLSMGHYGITSLLLVMVLHEWQYKPVVIRLAFMIFAPALTVFYFVFGTAFEVRIYWELYPALAVMILPTLLELGYKKPDELLLVQSPK